MAAVNIDIDLKIWVSPKLCIIQMNLLQMPYELCVHRLCKV